MNDRESVRECRQLRMVYEEASRPLEVLKGVDMDVRRDHPHAAYDKVDWEVIVMKNGDVFDNWSCLSLLKDATNQSLTLS